MMVVVCVCRWVMRMCVCVCVCMFVCVWEGGLEGLYVFCCDNFYYGSSFLIFFKIPVCLLIIIGSDPDVLFTFPL